MATIQVTPEELERTAGLIDNLAVEYEGQYKQLYVETDAMASTWSGKDNLAFTNQIAGFKDDFERMRKLMSDYADFLRKSAKLYRERQDYVTSEAKKMAN